MIQQGDGSVGPISELRTSTLPPMNPRALRMLRGISGPSMAIGIILVNDQCP